jgi:hypothetical protein
MKIKNLLLFLFIFLSNEGYTQNLVPNPSFEDTISCPIGGGQLYKAEHWSSFRFSPDYFHSCCNSINNSVVGVPANDLGFQYAHSGNAYAGMITYDLTGAPYREYLGVNLSNTLTVGTKYFLSFYLNWSGKIGFTIATNKFGVVITDSLFTSTNPYPISNNPIVYSDSIVVDSVGWVQIQLSFTASIPANYLVFGNFFDDMNTDTLNLGVFNQHAYYFIDDVCLSADSIYCYSFSSNSINIQQSSRSELIKSFHMYENTLIVEFQNNNDFKQMDISSIFGTTITEVVTNNNLVHIPLNQSNGVHILRVRSKNKIETIKFVR